MVIKLDNYNIRQHNTFRMNVACREWIEYTEPSDLPAIVAELGQRRFMHVGAGSNLLFLDDFDGALLHSRILDVETSFGDNGEVLVRAGSGVVLDDLIAQTVAAGLWGLENLSGIPGEVGSSAVQNVGAYGLEAKDVITKVECYDIAERRFREFSGDECRFAYRYSMFKSPEVKGRYIITFVTYRLTSRRRPVLDYGHLRSIIDDADSVTSLELREAIIEMRDGKLPAVEKVGSAGSFFKNPIIQAEHYTSLLKRIHSTLGADVEPPHFVMPDGIKVPAAWLIDKSGLKGATSGGAAVWSKQPLVIVNASGNATPEDILNLENHVIATVDKNFGITLSPEVEHIK